MMLLDVQKLSVDFETPKATVRALNQVGVQIQEGEVVGIVGESGSGKSTLAYSIMRLLTHPPASVSGSILFQQRDILDLTEKEMRSIRGNDISIVFQDSLSSLNSALKVGTQIGESLKIHNKISSREIKRKVIETLEKVQMANPAIVYDSYPYQLSGGMRQRVAIASAIINEPKLLIADEPTSSLDVTIQRQIIDLFKTLKKKLTMTMILITHDLGVAASICDRIIVMYAGRVVEIGTLPDIFHSPSHPYTIGLMNATPRPGNEVLRSIPGDVPDLRSLGTGCCFEARCIRRRDVCKKESPIAHHISSTHVSSCHFAEEISGMMTEWNS